MAPSSTQRCPKDETPASETSMGGWTGCVGTGGDYGGSTALRGTPAAPQPQLSFLGWTPKAATLKAQVHNPEHFGTIHSASAVTPAISPTGSHSSFPRVGGMLVPILQMRKSRPSALQAILLIGMFAFKKTKVVGLELGVLCLCCCWLGVTGTVEVLSSSVMLQGSEGYTSLLPSASPPDLPRQHRDG